MIGDSDDLQKRSHTSWLRPTPAHRERFLDMQDRLRFARALTMAAALLISATVADVSHPLVVGLAAATLAVVVAGSANLRRRRRPELWIFGSAVVNIQLALSAGIELTGGPRSPMTPLLAVPVVMVAARFSNRGLAVGAPMSVAMVLASTIAPDPGYVLGHPAAVVVPLVLVICTAAYLSPLVASDVRHRSDSSLDELTGMLNRRALTARFAEIRDQAAIAALPVSVVLSDVDHFKQVNDTHGHAAGDDVLLAVAGSFRSRLRSFELLYRFGGEEFLLLLPGADESAAALLAEQLRAAVEDSHPAGLDVTCSFGVAAALGAHVELDEMIRAADVALYVAKANGRNPVKVASGALAPAPRS